MMSYYHHTSAEPFIYRTIGDQLDVIAEQFSDRECLILCEENKRYTYALLHAEVTRFAQVLLSLGFNVGDRLGVWLPTTSHNICVTFAAAKVGVIKVNLNPAYTGKELGEFLALTGCRGLIFQRQIKSLDDCWSRLNSILPELHQSMPGALKDSVLTSLQHVILVSRDDRGNELAHQVHLLHQIPITSSVDDVTVRQRSLDCDSPACIFFSSGTTGLPKPATLSHFALVNDIIQPWGTDYDHFYERLCSPVPIYFIFGYVNALLHILNMKRPTCVIYPLAIMGCNMVPTMRAIEEERCTALLGVPTIFFDLMRHERRHEYNLKSLKLAVLSGAPVSSALIRQIEHELNIPHVTQVYGQTEASRIASTSNVQLGDISQRYESMGKCVPHREIKIIDIISKRVVPLGEPGEICTRSFRTMRGYWSNTAKTQEAIDDAQWLHTGDIGMLDANGCVYLRGRIKDVIIRGGVNIFPLEIEACLEQHPAIERAQVFGIPDERLGELVCAMVVAKYAVDIDELRRFLTRDLAYFKIPTKILIVTEFPTTSTGKIQKFKLAEIMMQHLSTEKKE